MSEYPQWLRIGNIVAGITFIILALGVLLDFGLAKQILIILLSFILVLVSLTRAVNGISDQKLTEKMKYMNMFIGAFGLAMALTAMVIYDASSYTTLSLLGIGIASQGVARIAVGGTDQALATWIRGLLITVGVITIILAIIVIFLQDLEETILISILAYAFIANGAARIAKGLGRAQEK